MAGQAVYRKFAAKYGAFAAKDYLYGDRNSEDAQKVVKGLAEEENKKSFSSDGAVKADNFHPMRGDVEDGKKVLFSSGMVGKLKQDGTKWHVVDSSGNRIISGASGAYDLTDKILGYNR